MDNKMSQLDYEQSVRDRDEKPRRRVLGGKQLEDALSAAWTAGEVAERESIREVLLAGLASTAFLTPAESEDPGRVVWVLRETVEAMIREACSGERS